MTVTVKVLVPSKLLEPVPTIQYSCLTKAAIIDKCVVMNVSDFATITVDIVIDNLDDPVAFTGGLFLQKLLQPLESYTCPEIAGFALGYQDRIITGTLGSGSCSMRITGREIS